MSKIVHVDLDAFYASVEQRDNSCYRDKPLVVGGLPQERGVVVAASYQARKFGIHSAMPSYQALQKYPNLIFVPPRFEVYRSISKQIHAIFKRYTDLVEPVALDEAYLDVTQNKLGLPYATTIAKQIKAEILAETGLTASAGVSQNKFLAKMASGMNKPNGLTAILPEQAPAFVAALPIEKFHGIGQVTASKMHNLGIHTGFDLKRYSEDDLVRYFGKVGRFYYLIARGEDNRIVEPNRKRKSIGAETSFTKDLNDLQAILLELETIAQTVQHRLESYQALGRTITLKVKFADYQQITRSRTVTDAIGEAKAISQVAKELLATISLQGRSVRLSGISLSNLDYPQKPRPIQLCLFESGV
ncbi:DNA polymerase IV [Aliterella atlantica CENA595]|uniref:DNA polymerase IV n=1 Tax=Aliterella atlantica CENA595 TaxID=1618023 RepID=A0A0D8ZNN0_9CYAN|nr:DNA polymerase IV [Aliterella atlantica CENA595]